jgi:hypothetical protein
VTALLVMLAMLGVMMSYEAIGYFQREGVVTHGNLTTALHALRRSDIAPMPTTVAVLAEARATVGGLEATLPEKVDQMALIDDLQRVAARHGLTIVRLEPVSEAAGPAGSRSTVDRPALRYQLGLVGSEVNVRRYLDELVKLPYPTLAVEGITLNEKGTRLTIAVYLRPPVPTPTPPARPKPAAIPAEPAAIPAGQAGGATGVAGGGGLVEPTTRKN